MEIATLENFLRRHSRLALDTSVFIYHLESNTRYDSLTRHVFNWLRQANHAAVTSTVTMTELLVKPYRNTDRKQVRNIYTLLSTFPNLEWISPDLAIADTAAKIRASHRLATPDALQAATAVHGKATGLITNDAAFERVGLFETMVLEQLLRPAY